jgi:hypothetical protein
LANGPLLAPALPPCRRVADQRQVASSGASHSPAQDGQLTEQRKKPTRRIVRHPHDRQVHRMDRLPFVLLIIPLIVSNVIEVSFAVFRLMTSSNLVGCSIGRSAALAPRAIRSMNSAARLNSGRHAHVMRHVSERRAEKSHHRHRWLLCARPNRPRGRRAAEQRDERAAFPLMEKEHAPRSVMH